MRIVLIGLSLFLSISVNAQYLLDSGTVGYIHHVKSYQCKLSLRKMYDDKLFYKGYIYSMDSNEIICCKVKPKLINPNNVHNVKFSKFFIENINNIGLRKDRRAHRALGYALLEGVLPGILIASSDPTLKNKNTTASNGGLMLLGGIAYTIFMTPIYYGINTMILSHYEKIRIKGLKENYYKNYQKLHVKTFGY